VAPSFYVLVLHNEHGTIRQWWRSRNAQKHGKGLVTDVSGPQRNACPGTLTPPFFQLDAQTLRSFPIHESLATIFRLEAFNVLNHPDFGLTTPQTLTPSTFGQVSSTATGNAARVFQGSVKIALSPARRSRPEKCGTDGHSTARSGILNRAPRRGPSYLRIGGEIPLADPSRRKSAYLNLMK
jgi:hypothetical protein